MGLTSFEPKRLVALGTIAACAMACGSSSQGVRSPADRAAFMERTRCGADDDDKTVGPVLAGTAVVGVQPLYSNQGTSKSGTQSELRGAMVSVSALPGVTAEWLDRALECHAAKAMLGHVQASDDPFWLPDASLDVDVRSAKDGFEISVAAFSPDDARRVLARATAFAGSKASGTAK